MMATAPKPQAAAAIRSAPLSAVLDGEASEVAVAATLAPVEVAKPAVGFAAAIEL